MPNDTELIYTAEAAVILKVSPRTVARMAKKGLLKPAGGGGGTTRALVFNRADIDALLDVAS